MLMCSIKSQLLMNNKIILLIIGAFYFLSSCQKDETSYWVEAEQFDDTGGWSVDAQFIDQMGSSYLLAHGLGEPVEPAITTIKISTLGKYYVWVRTKDWAPYPTGPGKFSISIGDIDLPVIFGQDGDSDWHWQSGGCIDILQNEIKIQIKDLSGFEGRIDAIYFSTNQTPPPSDPQKLNIFRKQKLQISNTPQDAGEFDLVVVGGGISGMCAAIQAARMGLKVALIQNRPVLGGNNSSEIRIPMNGDMSKNIYPQIGNIVKEITSGITSYNAPAEAYGDQKKLELIQNEKNISLYLSTHVSSVKKKGNKISEIIAQNTISHKEFCFKAPLYVDCTGDGNLGYLAGALYKMGREGFNETQEPKAPLITDNLTMGTTNHWFAKLQEYESTFPSCPWAVQFQPGYYSNNKNSEWYWETGFYDDKITNAEFIRDYNFRVIYGHWAFLKNHKQKENAFWKLKWMAYIAGKRESRRLIGDIILSELDLKKNTFYPDACVTTTWGIDLHYPDPKNTQYYPLKEFWGIADHNRNFHPYHIPYRCLYSKNVHNLFMAGRNISVTHIVLGTTRVMNTCGMMGEVVGKAAFLCKKYNCIPREIYEKYLHELISTFKE